MMISFFLFKEVTVASALLYFSQVSNAFLYLFLSNLSLLCSFFGGGDMNGISLLIPEIVARVLYGIILISNLIVFAKIVLPRYKLAFVSESQ